MPDLIMNLTRREMSCRSKMSVMVVAWESKSSTLSSHSRGHLASTCSTVSFSSWQREQVGAMSLLSFLRW